MPPFDDLIGQPRHVNETLRAYLGMTAPREYDDDEEPTRPLFGLIGESGLGLEDGNDFA